MIMDHPAVQDPGPMGRVLEEAIPVQDSKAIMVDMAIRATRVVIANKDHNSNSQGTKVTQCS